jgi:glycosyltransferase involved in cell wall biosynthesis
MKKNRVFLCWTLNSGTSFYRMMNPARYMRNQLSLGFSKWKPDFQGVADWEYRIKDPQVGQDLHVLISECDITISQKFHSIGGLALMDCYRHQWPKKPWYTDIDDHVFAINPSSPAAEQYFPGSEQEKILREQITISTGIITSTEYLRKMLERINPNVWVVPNGIDFKTWDALKEKITPTPRAPARKKIRIGWAGGGSHLDDLEFIEPVVTSIAKRLTNVEFVFLGGVPPCFKERKNIEANSRWYPIDQYPQALKDLRLDIALAPLKDNEFNRGKSNLRWLEYSALKIPTVASSVEPFKCIKNGEDGVLVTEPGEWEDALVDLIEDEGKRKKVGLAAYDRVKKDFNVETIAKEYVEKVTLMIAGKGNISKEAAVAALAGGWG